jgi:hypothetical protein
MSLSCSSSAVAEFDQRQTHRVQSGKRAHLLQPNLEVAVQSNLISLFIFIPKVRVQSENGFFFGEQE